MPSELPPYKGCTLVLPGLLRLVAELSIDVFVSPLFLDRRRTARMAGSGQNDPTPHWRPGSRHIPHEAGGLETPEPPAPQTPIQARGRALRKRGIQTPKQAAQMPIAPQEPETLPGATRRQQILFRLVVEGEKADHRQITVAIVVAIEKGESVAGRALGSSVGSRSMVMRRARPCSRLRWRAMTQSASAFAHCANSSWRSGHFQNATTWAARPDPHRQLGSRPTNNLCTGSHARRARRWRLHIPKAMPITAASAALHFVQDLAPVAALAQTGSQRGSQTSLRSAALSKIAPPSELPWR